MPLTEYFKEKNGMGVLSTADTEGRVNSAVYARPHVIDQDTVAFIMSSRRSLGNVKQNPYASFLFIEEGGRYQGKRLGLTLLREERDKRIIDDFRKARSPETYERYKNLDATLMYFKVYESRPLIGDDGEG
ncbi:MAG: pyridoxamine 5'-phosphate oxidase family protein [Myxococcales bacterium]|nr:MAG: pyridoxamine 5'-phosphate oxidase family protein [Myxococcales bacterium]